LTSSFQRIDFHDEEVVEITGNNESVQLLGEVSLPASAVIPSPDLWWDLEKPLIEQPARCKEASFSIAAIFLEEEGYLQL